MAPASDRRYKATESKYKGGAEEMYVTYDLLQQTRGASQALYPKVKRVYIAGKIKQWQVGTLANRTGKKVYGVKIDYEQSREGYTRKAYTATRGGAPYQVPLMRVKGSASSFSKMVTVPEDAQNVQSWRGLTPIAHRCSRLLPPDHGFTWLLCPSGEG
jgi:hypothetical protein